jgi:hypothetical protein
LNDFDPAQHLATNLKKKGDSMAKWILLDEFHLSVHVLANLSKSSPIVRTLRSKRFQSRLRSAIGRVIQSHPTLKPVKVTLSR